MNTLRHTPLEHPVYTNHQQADPPLYSSSAPSSSALAYASFPAPVAPLPPLQPAEHLDHHTGLAVCRARHDGLRHQPQDVAKLESCRPAAKAGAGMDCRRMLLGPDAVRKP